MPRIEQLQAEIEQLKASQSEARSKLYLDFSQGVLELDKPFFPLEEEIRRIKAEKRVVVGPWKPGTGIKVIEGCSWSCTRHLLAGDHSWFSQIVWLKKTNMEWECKDWSVWIPNTLKIPGAMTEVFLNGSMEEAQVQVDTLLLNIGFVLLHTKEEVEAQLALW